jgi:hypothetical protein
MTKKINSSPERHTFQKEGYIKRCEEKGEEPNPAYVEMYKTWREQDAENLVDPDWQQNNLEYDLRSTEWIIKKAQASESYAQNIYAALCNNDFQRNSVWPILKGQTWSCSWRHAGGIVADMLGYGDYIDWYCSGIKNNGYRQEQEQEQKEFTPEQLERIAILDKYVPESVVTDEIREDLFKLGWTVVNSIEE